MEPSSAPSDEKSGAAGDSEDGGKGGSGEGVTVDFGGGEEKMFIPTRCRLQLLTPRQYAHAVHDLLALPETTFAKLALDPVSAISGYDSIGASVAAPSLVGVELMASEANRLATAALASSDARATLLGCNPQNGVFDRPCARRFVERFGRRAFRRTLEPEESERWSSIPQATGAGYTLTEELAPFAKVKSKMTSCHWHRDRATSPACSQCCFRAA